MKRLFLVLVLVGITGVSLFAWEPQDLTKFPIGQDGKSWILNFGIGVPYDYGYSAYKDYISIPPMRLSLDKNVEMGDKKLPFFIGGIFGYSGWGYTGRVFDYDRYEYHDKKYFYNRISIGGRFGYHFNWDVKNLDTYAVTTAGWIIYTGDYADAGFPLWGVNVGARYFVNNWFGFWLETGYTSFSWLDIGLAFKF